jgi:large subunit ribosomal protein L3
LSTNILFDGGKTMSGILAKKIGMTQIFEDGKFIPVTVVEAGPNYVLQKKTVENDGYTALQLGFDEKKEKNTTKPVMGIFKKAGVNPQRFVKELRVDSVEGFELGQEIKADVLADVAYVDITGTSKGKGTSGVMKRHGFGGNRASHGVSRNHRLGGSIGMSSWPGKVLKGKRMAGQYGNVTVTVQNLKVVKVDAENNLVLIKGAVPGAKNGYIVIKPAVKK